MVLEENQLYYAQFQTLNQAYVLICGNNRMRNMAGFEFERNNYDGEKMIVSRKLTDSSVFLYVYPCDFSMQLTEVHAYDQSGNVMKEPVLLEGLPAQGGD